MSRSSLTRPAPRRRASRPHARVSLVTPDTLNGARRSRRAPPAPAPLTRRATPLAGGPDGGLDYARAAGERREQQRRAGAVSAVLAAANARRDIASAQAGDADLTRMLAESREPAYRHGHEGGREHHEEIAKTWFGQGMRMNSGIYRKIGMQNPGDTRRV